jgi:hypothetical protein
MLMARWRGGCIVGPIPRCHGDRPCPPGPAMVTVLIALPALPWSPWLMSLIPGRARGDALDHRRRASTIWGSR